MGGEGDLIDPSTIPQAKIGKWAFWVAILFLCWMTHYVMHEPPGFVY